MKIYKALLLGILSFLALEGATYAEKIDVDIYIEGPGLTSRLQDYPDPELTLWVGPMRSGSVFALKGEELDHSEQRLLKERASLNITESSGYKVIPPCKYQVKPYPEVANQPSLCGKAGNMIRAYNDAGKPLQSLIFVTEMYTKEIAKGSHSFVYAGTCSIKTEYQK